MLWQSQRSIDPMVLGILINWDQEESPIRAHQYQYFFLKYNPYNFVLIKTLEMAEGLMVEHIWSL